MKIQQIGGVAQNRIGRRRCKTATSAWSSSSGSRKKEAATSVECGRPWLTCERTWRRSCAGACGRACACACA
eukprot:5861695-Pleurochrysis_carterae.AAC.1